MKTTSLLLAALFAAVATACAGDCRDTFNVESRTENYVSASDILLSETIDPFEWPGGFIIQQAAGLIDAFQGGTNCLKLNLVGISASSGNASFSYDSFMKTAGGAAFGFGKDGFSINDVITPLIPTLSPCDGRLVDHFTHFGGNMSALVEQAGIGIYTRKITKGTFHMCRDVVVVNNSGAAIEFPLSVSGELAAIGSFGISDRNYAKAHLSLHGSVGGQTVNSEASIAIGNDQYDLGYYYKDINETKRVTIPSSPVPQNVHIDVTGEAECNVQASGGSRFGLVVATSQSTCIFPNSIKVGLPTGVNGAPLPPGIRIYDAEDGSVYMDSTGSPVDFVAVPGQTPVWDFSRPFDVGLGGLNPSVNSTTFGSLTTIYSPPGTLAGLVRRADGDADPPHAY